VTPFDRLASEAATYGKLMRRAHNCSDRRRPDPHPGFSRGAAPCRQENAQLQWCVGNTKVSVPIKAASRKRCWCSACSSAVANWAHSRSIDVRTPNSRSLPLEKAAGSQASGNSSGDIRSNMLGKRIERVLTGSSPWQWQHGGFAAGTLQHIEMPVFSHTEGEGGRAGTLSACFRLREDQPRRQE
jgi:hypothetical protein